MATEWMERAAILSRVSPFSRGRQPASQLEKQRLGAQQKSPAWRQGVMGDGR
jgi:hypothetical protein